MYIVYIEGSSIKSPSYVNGTQSTRPSDKRVTYQKYFYVLAYLYVLPLELTSLRVGEKRT